jgi:hypothetical protein
MYTVENINFIKFYVLKHKHVFLYTPSPDTLNKGKAIPLQALTGPEGSRRLGLPYFKTIGIWRWQGCQPYAPTAFTP